MDKLTSAQKKWLTKLQRSGFVEAGGWNRGQKNRPLNKLVSLGLAEHNTGPKGCLLQTYGYVAKSYGPYFENLIVQH